MNKLLLVVLRLVLVHLLLYCWSVPPAGGYYLQYLATEQLVRGVETAQHCTQLHSFGSAQWENCTYPASLPANSINGHKYSHDKKFPFRYHALDRRNATF